MIPLFNQRKTFDLLREAFYSPHKAFFNRDSRKINSSSVKRPLDSAVCTSLNTGEEKVERQGKCYVRNTLNGSDFPTVFHSFVSIEQILESIKAF